MNRISAIERLRQVPPVFHLRDLVVIHAWQPARASTMLTRWRRQGLVEPAGEGVWFNRVVDPDGPHTRRFEAIGRMFPAAVVIGATVLHDAGWTTQVPHRTAIAVPPRRSHPDPATIEVCPRPRAWFRKIEPFLSTGAYPIPSLTPAAALADALCYRPGWRPDPDDIEFDDEEKISAFEAAFRAIKKQRQRWPEEWKGQIGEEAQEVAD